MSAYFRGSVILHHNGNLLRRGNAVLHNTRLAKPDAAYLSVAARENPSMSAPPPHTSFRAPGYAR